MCDISAFRDLVIAGAAATTAIAAVIGLTQWRSELKGKTYFEANRNILRALYKLREEIRMCRSPLIRVEEFPSDTDQTAANYSENAKAYAHVYSNRWKPVRDAAVEFDTWLIEAEVLWGKEAHSLGEEVERIVHELFVSIESYLDELRADPDIRDKEFGKSLRKILHGSPDDEWSKKLLNAISKFEEFLKRKLAKYA